jgi:hypothetical protein
VVTRPAAVPDATPVAGVSGRAATALLAGPMVLMALHQLIGYTIAEFHCRYGVLAGEIAGTSAVRFVLVAISAVWIVVLGALVVATVAAQRRNRRNDGDAVGATGILLFCALLLAGFVGFYMVWSTVMLVATGMC